MKKYLFTILFFTLILSGCSNQEENTNVENNNSANEESKNTGLANPASTNCIEKGGELEMQEGENGTEGICKFEDGTECEEWSYFRGECGDNSENNNKNAIGNENIKIFNIENNSTVLSPVTIKGEGSAFENNLIVELRNINHETLVKENTTIKSSEIGENGPFEITINFQFSGTKEGFIAVYEQSAKDGSELNLVEIPVKFKVSNEI